MGVRDPEAAARVVSEWVELLDENYALWTIARDRYKYSDEVRKEAAQNARRLDREILEGHALVAAIARQIQPGLHDVIGGHMNNDALYWTDWKWAPLIDAARILKGAAETLAETERIVGPMTHQRRRSTPEERQRYGLALLARDAVAYNEVDSKEIGAELGFSDEVRGDIEQYLSDAGLLELVAMGPMVCLTHEGRLWAEGGAPTTSMPPSTTITNINVTGDHVNIQAAGANSSQTMSVENTFNAVREWIEQVRNLVEQPEFDDHLQERGAVLVRLENLADAVNEPKPDRGKVKNLIGRVVGELAVAVTATMAAPGVMDMGHHLMSLL